MTGRDALTRESEREWSRTIAEDRAGYPDRAYERSAEWCRWKLESHGHVVVSGPVIGADGSFGFVIRPYGGALPAGMTITPPPHAAPVGDAMAWHAERAGYGAETGETDDSGGPGLF